MNESKQSNMLIQVIYSKTQRSHTAKEIQMLYTLNIYENQLNLNNVFQP